MIEREPNTEYILSLSYGKDSIACLEAIKQLGYPLDRIIHAEVWATDTIPADLPPMVEFKKYADKIIEEKYGIKTVGLTNKEQETTGKYTDSLTLSERDAIQGSKLVPCQELQKITYESLFYHIPKRRKNQEREMAGSDTDRVAERTRNSKSLQCDKSILGFPIPRGNWCNSNLKLAALRISNLNRQRELVYPTQTACFLIPPLHKAGRKILCSISA